MDFVDLGNHDFLRNSSLLRRLALKRVFFDPTNPVHLESMKHYLATGNWKTQFYPEDPFSDVPMTVLRKFAGHHMNVLVTTADRLDAEAKDRTNGPNTPL